MKLYKHRYNTTLGELITVEHEYKETEKMYIYKGRGERENIRVSKECIDKLDPYYSAHGIYGICTFDPSPIPFLKLVHKDLYNKHAEALEKAVKCIDLANKVAEELKKNHENI